MAFFTYILYSESLDRYYVGSTQDMSVRLEEHLKNHKGFTSKAKDWEVKYTESYPTRTEALRRERQIKKWKKLNMLGVVPYIFYFTDY
ncbi:GIY-YIG nuclease family protein [Zobellia galactanivorans]|uniref:Endonuclease n=2 Tax=Zobellia galactanivorans (strain DSM 12802 / CCUG 47099 / CIP 106680 / NCIMB 13871 / Dsij) TaxID=63186 RepID=G0L9Z9_ZOBGA|nr:GIY-YIG nuclease family protein [Zobellia galactanivorans]CAZ94964.1 Endonuclease [Zobellia galactanivorans]